MKLAIIYLSILSILFCTKIFDNFSIKEKTVKYVFLLICLLALPLKSIKLIFFRAYISGFVLPIIVVVYFIYKSIKNNELKNMLFSTIFTSCIIIFVLFFFKINIYKFYMLQFLLPFVITILALSAQKFYATSASAMISVFAIDVFCVRSKYKYLLGNIKVLDMYLLILLLINFSFAIINKVNSKNQKIDTKAYSNTNIIQFKFFDE